VYPPTKAFNKIKSVTSIKNYYVFQHWAAILRKLQNKEMYAQHYCPVPSFIGNINFIAKTWSNCTGLGI
jgi:hypothetical protein